jgi:hypothetical protein
MRNGDDMIKVVVVEQQGHVAPGAISELLSGPVGVYVSTAERVPVDLHDCSVLILNSLPGSHELPQDRIVSFIQNGGGVLCIHDTLFPSAYNQSLLSVAGVRLAYDAIGTEQHGDQYVTSFQLALGDPADPNRRFVVRVLPEQATHPIVAGIRDFELADEYWAINIAPGVKPLLFGDAGDRVRCHPRFRERVTVCGCLAVEKGKVAFLLVGHFQQTYRDANIIQVIQNSVGWLGGQLNELDYPFDVFLSFSSDNRAEAEKIRSTAQAKGLGVFMSEKNLTSGDVWDETIRQALIGSREMAVLVSPSSLRSEWVATEWGIAWALQKRITPVLFRCDVTQLPDRLKRYEARDLHETELYVSEVLSRKGGT